MAQKENYRDHKGALRELGARDEGKTEKQTQSGKSWHSDLLTLCTRKSTNKARKQAAAWASSNQLIWKENST